MWPSDLILYTTYTKGEDKQTRVGRLWCANILGLHLDVKWVTAHRDNILGGWEQPD